MITTSMIVTNIILLMHYAYFNNLNQEKNINTEHGMLLLELIIWIYLLYPWARRKIIPKNFIQDIKKLRKYCISEKNNILLKFNK